MGQILEEKIKDRLAYLYFWKFSKKIEITPLQIEKNDELN